MAKFNYEVGDAKEKFAHGWSFWVLPVLNALAFNAAFFSALDEGVVSPWHVGWLLATFMALPVVPLLKAFRSGVDFDVSSLKLRGTLYLVTGGIYLSGVPLFAALELPSWQFVLACLGLFSLVFGSVSFAWRISHHAGSSTTFTLVSILLLRDAPRVQLVFWLALPAVVFVTCYARLVLKRHSLAQLLVGTALAVAVCLLVHASYAAVLRLH